jgi:hypothetical protein
MTSMVCVNSPKEASLKIQEGEGTTLGADTRLVLVHRLFITFTAVLWTLHAIPQRVLQNIPVSRLLRARVKFEPVFLLGIFG